MAAGRRIVWALAPTPAIDDILRFKTFLQRKRSADAYVPCSRRTSVLITFALSFCASRPPGYRKCGANQNFKAGGLKLPRKPRWSKEECCLLN